MENDNQENFNDSPETIEEVAEETTEEAPKTEKPKRTPQEEYDYHMGRANRLAKKLGLKGEEKSEPKPEVKQDSSKPNDLDYGEKAYLRSALNLKGADELQLAKEWKNKYNSSVEEMETDEVFLNRLNGLREARASAQAVPKSKPRSGQTGVTDVDLAVAKYKETGELPSDFQTRTKVIDAITKSESSPLFQGPSIIKG